MNKIKVSHFMIESMVRHIASTLRTHALYETEKPIRVYGIPRGGVSVAYLLSKYTGILLAETPNDADIFVDDISDSGDTAREWTLRHGKPVIALVDRSQRDSPYNGKAAKDLLDAGWLVFPWESSDEKDEGIEGNIKRLLQYIGENPERGGLLETPHRVAKAWEHWTSGYRKDPASILKVFEDGADGCDEMVLVKDIPFYTHCEHHMAPFFGTASVAYIPNNAIVGLSKISRVVDMFARRLQVQERLTNQIADALADNLHPKGVGVVIKARHLCMESRGICQQGHQTVTSALRGVLKDKPEARAEFMALINK